MRIRDETAADKEPIHALVAQAFARSDEADLVDALREAGDLALSLVSEEAGEIVGHVALSRLTSPARSLALAPLAVGMSHQRRGIGSALIREVITRARAMGTDFVFVVGDPAYYARFGFSAAAAAPFPCPYAGPYFMALVLRDVPPPPAPVVYARAFARLT